MKLISRLFGISPSNHRSMPRAAMVYYAAPGILIAATHWDRSGWSGGGEPMVLLPPTAEPKTIGEHVLRSVFGSRTEITQSDLKASTASFFRLAGVSGWESLEERWKLVSASIEPGEELVTVLGMDKGEKGGYVSLNGGSMQKCKALPEDIGHVVWRILHEAEAAGRRSIDSSLPQNCSREGDARLLFVVGDRVADVFGNSATVVHVDAAAEHGLGTVNVRYDDGSETKFALAANGLRRMR